jgi:hypothetical protein
MTHELVYTSAPKGLKPGSRGFSTVAQTRHTPGVLAESLEALSGYKFAFPMGSSQERLNPVAYSHFILSSGGIAHHVLSRVSAAPPDYTGRSNKLAHHLVLTPAEAAQLPCGPAAHMKQPDFFKTSWSGEPHWIEAPRSLKACEATTSVCSQWKKTTGDAGWAGKLAEEWQSNLSSPLILVFPEGLDVLPLVEESLSLLPPADRWRLTFSTYFTSLPAGVRECSLRCILAGSEEHQKSLTQVGNRIVDLTKALPSLETSSLVDDARNGTRLTKPSTIPQIPKTSKPPAIKSVPTNEPPPPVRIEVVEDATWEPPDTFGPPTRTGSSRRNRRSRRRWAYPLIAAITALLLLAAGSFFLILRQSSTAVATTDKQPERPAASNSAAGQEPKEIKEAPPPPPVATESESVTEHPPHEEPADANTKQGQPTEAGTPKEKEAKNVPQERKEENYGKDSPPKGETSNQPADVVKSLESKSEGADNKEQTPPKQAPGKEETPKLRPDASQAGSAAALPGAGTASPPQKNTLAISKNKFNQDGHYKFSTNAADPTTTTLLDIGYPGDFIFIANEKIRTSIWKFPVNGDPIFTFEGDTPVIKSKSGQDYELLRHIAIKPDPNNPKIFNLFTNHSNVPIQVNLTGDTKWHDFITAWKTIHFEHFPRMRSKPTQLIDLKAKLNDRSVVDFDGDVCLSEMTVGSEEVQAKLKITEPDHKSSIEILTPDKNRPDGWAIVGIFDVSKEAIKWKGGQGRRPFSGVKPKLKSLFFIISPNEVVPCNPVSPNPEEFKLESSSINHKVDNNVGIWYQKFDLVIDEKKVDENFVGEALWRPQNDIKPENVEVIPEPKAPSKLALRIKKIIEKEQQKDTQLPPCFLEFSLQNGKIVVSLKNIPGLGGEEFRPHMVGALKDLVIKGDVRFNHFIGNAESEIVVGQFSINGE